MLGHQVNKVLNFPVPVSTLKPGLSGYVPKTISSLQVWVLLLSGKTEKAENTNIGRGVYESINNKWAGCIIIPLLV